MPRCKNHKRSSKNSLNYKRFVKVKAGIGYCPSTEEAKGKAIVKELNVTEKKKDDPQKVQCYCLKCNAYGHKASDCRVVKKIEKIPTSKIFAVLKIQCYRCGMFGHMARQSMKNVTIKCFKCRKLGHYA